MTRRIRLLIAALLALGGGLAVASTTTSAYDALAIARVGLDEIGLADASPAQVSGAQVESASPSVEARAASTTSFGPSAATNNVDDLARANAARDAAGRRVDGSPNRDSPAFVGGYDGEGNVIGTGNGPRGSGIHAEDIVQQRMPGAQMTEPYAWRTNRVTGELEWRPFTVCTTCQSKYPPSLFPSGTRGASGGRWYE